jgi:hypothetical protein
MAYILSRLPSWKGKYPISDTTHADQLQVLADINEHMHRMPRHQAEAAAHAQYRKEQIEKAAAHHWNGMKASHAAGNEEAAKKHGMMYGLALHQLGHKDLLSPPPEVLEAAKDPKSEIGHFKAHPGDAFSLPPEEPEEPKRSGNEKQVKDRAAAAVMQKDEGNPLFQKQGYQNHPLGSTGGGLKHDQHKQDELIDVAYHGAWPQEHKYIEGALGTKASFVPPEHHQVTSQPAAGAEGSILAGALVARQMIRHLIRKHAERNQLTKAEEDELLEILLEKTEDDAPAESEKCSACGGPFHPASGHYHQADVRVCGPCMKHFVQWFKGHSKGKYGHPKASFYEAAVTSIKPGMKGDE